MNNDHRRLPRRLATVPTHVAFWAWLLCGSVQAAIDPLDPAPMARTVAELLALDAARALQHERQAMGDTPPRIQSASHGGPTPAAPPAAQPVLAALYGTPGSHGLYAELLTPQGRWLFRQGRPTPLWHPAAAPVRWTLHSMTPPCVRLRDDAAPTAPLELCLEYVTP